MRQVMRGPSRQQLRQRDHAKRWMPSTPPQILRRQFQRPQFTQPLCPRPREVVQQLVQCLAPAVARVRLPIKRSKDSLLAGFQNHSRPRNPVLVLSMNQMRPNFTHAPCILALVALRPHLRQSPQQCVESRRSSLKQRNRVFEILFHPNPPFRYSRVFLFSSTRSPASSFSNPHLWALLPRFVVLLFSWSLVPSAPWSLIPSFPAPNATTA